MVYLQVKDSYVSLEDHQQWDLVMLKSRSGLLCFRMW